MGRIGGRNNGYVHSGDGGTPPLAIRSVKELNDTLTRVANEVHSAALCPKIATAMAALLSLQLLTFYCVDIEKKLAEQQKPGCSANER